MEEALRRSGLNGWNMDATNAMDGLSYGGTGLRPSLGVGGQGDLAHATGQLAGPIGSPATNLMNSIFANPADPWTRSVQMRFVPLHTIRQTHALMNWVAQEKNFKGQGPPFER
jgi:hypothetical protein